MFIGGLVLLSTGVGSVRGDEPPLAATVAAIEHHVVGGRIVIDRPRRFRGRLHERKGPAGRGETYRLADAATCPAERYTRVRPGRDVLTIEITDRERLTLVREPHGTSLVPTLTLTQVPGEPLRLEYDSPAMTRTIVAADLWRLYLAEPAACEEDLFPLLETLRPDWRLAVTGRAVLDDLLARPATPLAPAGLPPATAERVEELLAGIDAPTAVARRRAGRELADLLAAGTVTIESLTARAGLSGQQRATLAGLRSVVRQTAPDRPMSVAARLAADPIVWLTLLSHPQAHVRQRVAARLETVAPANPDAPSATSRWASRPATPTETAQYGRTLGLTR